MGTKIVSIGVIADESTLTKSGNTISVKDNGVSGDKIAMGSDAQGDMLYHDGTDYVRLPKGTTLQKLQMNAGATAPEWTALSSGQLRLISHQTPSAVANIQFASITGYEYLLLVWDLVTSDADVNITMQLNNIATASYTYVNTTGNAVATTSGASSFLLQDLANGDAGGTGGWVIMPVSARGSSNIHSSWGNGGGGDLAGSTFLKGKFAGAGDITNIDVDVSAGTMTGFITLYGIAEA